MSIENATVVDVIGVDRVSGEVVLTISDHLAWSYPAHRSLLEEKLDAYLRFILDGELAASYPAGRGRPVRIALVHKHRPDACAKAILAQAKVKLLQHDVGFSHYALSLVRKEKALRGRGEPH